MGRHKTISDERVLDVARAAFRRRGYAVSGREIARLAGVSEAVLYQRFASKDALFFAAVAPREPDLMAIFGPRGEEGDAHSWVRGAVDRLAAYFQDFLPLAVQVMLHPGSTPTAAATRGARACVEGLETELSARLRSLARRGAIAATPHRAGARLLIGMAHDWALQHAILSCCSPGDRRPLAALVDLAWHGIAPAGAGGATVEPGRAQGRRHRRAAAPAALSTGSRALVKSPG